MKKITKDMLIPELLQLDPMILAVLTRNGMHCIGCSSASSETLAQACEAHGIDPDVMTEQLNDFINFE